MAETLETVSTLPQPVAPDSTFLATLSREEFSRQMATAREYRRTIREFVSQATDLVTWSQETAGECIFAIPRNDKGKTKMIRGASVRFAEIILSCWTNCKVSAFEVGQDNQFVTARGIYYDLESNVEIRCDVKRRITDQRGRKYNADMIGVTSNAACSIAMRNAILKGIPRALWSAVYAAAEQCIAGDSRPLNERRDAAIAHFQKVGVQQERVYSALGIAGYEDLGGDELLTLQGIRQAIKDGELTVDAAFPLLRPAGAPVAPGATRSEEVKALLAGGKEPATVVADPDAAATVAVPGEPDLEVDTETGELFGIADERAEPPE